MAQANCAPGSWGGDTRNSIFAYALILVLFAAVLLLLDILLAYYSRNKSLNLLIQRAEQSDPDRKELEKLLEASGKSPPGIPGLARSMMALTVIVILGVAVFHLLAKSEVKDTGLIVNNILSMLAGLLAAITWFYFGGRASESKAEGAGKPAGKPPGQGGESPGGAGPVTGEVAE